MEALVHMSKVKLTKFLYATGYVWHWHRWPIVTVAARP